MKSVCPEAFASLRRKIHVKTLCFISNSFYLAKIVVLVFADSIWLHNSVLEIHFLRQYLNRLVKSMTQHHRYRSARFHRAQIQLFSPLNFLFTKLNWRDGIVKTARSKILCILCLCLLFASVIKSECRLFPG